MSVRKKGGGALRILLLIDKLDVGGAETHVVTLATELRRQGHSVAVVSSGGVLENALRQKGVVVLHFLRPLLGLYGWWKNLRFIQACQRQYSFEILHAHTRRTAALLRLVGWLGWGDLPPLPFEQAARGTYRPPALRRLNRPVRVVTAHAKFRASPRRLSYWGERTVAVSEDIKRHLQQVFSLPARQISVIANGLDRRVFYPPTGESESDGVARVRVVFASRLDDDCSTAAHQLLALSEAWAVRAEQQGRVLTVTVIGGGTQYAPLRRYAEQINARRAGLIEMTGGQANVAPLLREGDLFVGVSRAALEALACGCRVLLAGDEGFGGILSVENFDRFAASNFCCRGEPPLTQAALDAAFDAFLQQPATENKRQIQTLQARLWQRYDAAHMTRETLAVYRSALQEHRTLHAMIGGYGGCGNLGDDAILRQLIARWHGQTAPLTFRGTPFDSDRETLQKVEKPQQQNAAASTGEGTWYGRGSPAPQLRVTVMVGKRWRDTPGVKRVGRQLLRLSFWRAVRRADVFLLGGGSLLQSCSAHGKRSLLYYLFLILTVRATGCPVFLVANGVGPIEHPWLRRLTVWVLRHVQGISLREAASCRRLISWGLEEGRLTLARDPALGITPASQASCRAWLRRLLPLGGEQLSLVCVAPQRGASRALLSALAAALRALWEQKRLFPLFIVMDEQQDGAVCRHLQSLCGVGRCVLPPSEQLACGLFALSRGVIGMRLHALIFASVARAPAIGVSVRPQDDKLAVFARQGGYLMAPLTTNAAAWERLIRQRLLGE